MRSQVVSRRSLHTKSFKKLKNAVRENHCPVQSLSNALARHLGKYILAEGKLVLRSIVRATYVYSLSFGYGEFIQNIPVHSEILLSSEDGQPMIICGKVSKFSSGELGLKNARFTAGNIHGLTILTAA